MLPQVASSDRNLHAWIPTPIDGYPWNLGGWMDHPEGVGGRCAHAPRPIGVEEEVKRV